MKKIFCLFTLLALFSALRAEESGLEAQAELLYREGKYREAAETYNRILAGGEESASLYYNLGNSYYKAGENTSAILQYERALLLAPGNADVRYNLKLARQQVVDKIEVLPELFFIRWYKAFVSLLSADQWGYVSVALFILCLVLAAFFLYSRSAWMKRTGFTLGIVCLLLALGALLFANRQNSLLKERRYAIVTTPSVTVRGAPDGSGTSLFIIHEGLKVRIVEALGEWTNIRLEDGNEGWVRHTDIERI
ncbi:MAG: tetratricopeptide repeat protein [Culturomica sp.]|jgi:tetratricopeptide (TPR) repeat protein|nr:tetratricopeptide repeat protein [Culturomica sp.]